LPEKIADAKNRFQRAAPGTMVQKASILLAGFVRRSLFLLNRLEVIENSVDSALDGHLALLAVFLAAELEA